ncbi:MAG: ATP-dependent 6-phosphofructokinase [Pseudomonadota bacterium]
MTERKRIGILTSGGDCAGLNAAIRAAVNHANVLGWTTLGIREGTHGLLSRPLNYLELKPEDFSGNIMRQGGTLLGSSNKGDPFAMSEGGGKPKNRAQEVVEGYRSLDLDALIAIGGDGSFRILRKLARKGINLVCIPKTIDNDVDMTETSIGFETAVNVATEALDRLQPTAASHHRVMVLEVMGREAGHIALSSGIAGGADVILIPEIPYNIDHVAQKIEDLRRRGRNFALVVVSESIQSEDNKNVMQTFTDGETRYGGVGHAIGEQISRVTGAETRVTILGHVQRGSPPIPRDRIIAAAFGVHAVELVKQGRFDRMVSWNNRAVTNVPIARAIAKYRDVDHKDALIKTARCLGICLGDRPAD